MGKKKVKAICLKTYPDENDMQDCCDGNIEPCDVRIYHKGREYLVDKECDKNYYILVEDLTSDETTKQVLP